MNLKKHKPNILNFTSKALAHFKHMVSKQGKENKIRLVKWMLWITIICAAIFAVNKYFEYSYKISNGITPGTDIFYSIYYAATGVHMLHVFIGMAVLGVLLKKVNEGRYHKGNFTAIEIGGLYWPLLDLI